MISEGFTPNTENSRQEDREGDFELLELQAFVDDLLLQSEDGRTSEMGVRTYLFEQGEAAATVGTALCNVAARGGKASLYMDAINQNMAQRDPMSWRWYCDFVQHLRETGVEAHLTGNLSRTTFLRIRNLIRVDHRKLAYVLKDDGSGKAYIGGTNIGDRFGITMPYSDPMFRFSDPLYVDVISAAFHCEGPDTHGWILHDPEMLFSEGTSRGRIIMEMSKKLVGRAQHEIILVTPLLPVFSLLGEIINARKRGVKVTIITSLPPERALLASVYTRYSTRIPATLRAKMAGIEVREAQVSCHPKMLIVDGEAIIGSHNLTNATDLFRMGEVAIYLARQHIVEKVRNYALSLLPPESGSAGIDAHTQSTSSSNLRFRDLIPKRLCAV